MHRDVAGFQPLPFPTARYDPTLSGELKPLQAAQMEELPWEGAARMPVDGSMEGDMKPIGPWIRMECPTLLQSRNMR